MSGVARFLVGPVDDADAALAIARACDVAEVGVAVTEPRHITDDLEDPAVDVARDTWLVRAADGTPVAFAIVFASDPDGLQRSWARVHPDHATDDLAALVFDRLEERARGRAEGAPAPRVNTLVDAADPFLASFLERRGYVEVRRLHHLQRALGADDRDPGAPPAGVSARRIDAATDLAALADLDDEVFRGSFGYTRPTLDRWRAQFLEPAHPASTLVLDGDRAVAFALLMPGEPAWIEVIGVAADHRRRGIATWLLRRAFHDLAADGVATVRLAVDGANPHGATRVYERAGMRVLRTSVVVERPL
ncbi:MAG: GNAT family N-acetyltransferase [Actinomycetota bacterium]